jgi:ligand-binding sensor domain-containing protein/signal transduction histidine kinase
MTVKPTCRCVNLFIGIVVWSSLFRAAALDPRTEISSYTHDRWGTGQGFVGGPVYAFAQTPDGYLWIGTEKGLARFDGLTFRLFDHANSPDFPVSAVLGLTTDVEGTLWVRLRNPKLLRYRSGRFDVPLPNLSSWETSTAMLPTADGGLLIAHANRILKYRKGQFSTLAAATDALNLLVISMAETRDGTVWLGTRDAGLFSLRKGKIVNITKGLPDSKVNSIVAVGGSQVWIGTDNGVVRWTGTEVTKKGIPDVLQHLQTLAMLRDQDANIWAAASEGLVRVTPTGAFSRDRRKKQPDDRISALFEDKDGNLWVGNSDSIERYRESLVTTYYRPESPQSQNEGPLYVDDAGRTWFAPSEGGLYWFKGSQVQRITQDGLADDVVYSLSGSGSELWVGRQRGGLTCLQYRGHTLTATTYTSVSGLAPTSIAVVHRCRDGTVWAGSVGGGVSKLSLGKLTNYTIENGLASNSVNAIAETSDRGMWFAGPNGLTRFLDNRWRTFTSADGLPPGDINCLFNDSHGVLWIGTDRGLAYIDSGRLTIPQGMPQSLMTPVLGIAGDRDGWLWITTANRVFRAQCSALRLGRGLEIGLREFGPDDGLSSDGGVRSIVADDFGRIWLSLHRAISVVDPQRLSRASRPIDARILNVLADGKPLNLSMPIGISAERQRITFEFAGLSLSAPERVRFRYQLVNYDAAWSAPGRIREADYTNLAPGPYRFRVAASNPDGVWSKNEASISFTVEPLFWQTWSFRILVALAVGLCLTGVYRFRVGQVTRQLNLRFAERLAERNHIAQELHDTLLQGFLGASMLLNVMADDLPKESNARRQLGRALTVMNRVIEEGRDTLRGLRTQEDSFGIDQAFSRVGEELAVDHNLDFRVIAEGEHRALHPVIRDEVYRIGREALVNAFRHSKANRVEIQLEYGSKSFCVQVRDDGCGIRSEVLHGGIEGHWGLIGMRERAERIGARFKVLTRESGGTEVQLFVPNRIAFENEPSRYFWRWFTRLHVSMKRERR